MDSTEYIEFLRIKMMTDAQLLNEARKYDETPIVRALIERLQVEVRVFDSNEAPTKTSLQGL